MGILAECPTRHMHCLQVFPGLHKLVYSWWLYGNFGNTHVRTYRTSIILQVVYFTHQVVFAILNQFIMGHPVLLCGKYFLVSSLVTVVGDTAIILSNGSYNYSAHHWSLSNFVSHQWLCCPGCVCCQGHQEFWELSSLWRVPLLTSLIPRTINPWLFAGGSWPLLGRALTWWWWGGTMS